MAASGIPIKCAPEIETLWMDIKNNENDKVISILKKHGTDSSDGERRTALMHAVFDKNREIFDWALANGADVNFQDKIGYTALHFAAQNNSFEYAKLLLDSDANPNMQDVHGNIPLWTAMFNSKLAISDTTRLLLKHNSNVELHNNYGKNCQFMFKTFLMGIFQQLIFWEFKLARGISLHNIITKKGHSLQNGLLNKNRVLSVIPKEKYFYTLFFYFIEHGAIKMYKTPSDVWTYWRRFVNKW